MFRLVGSLRLISEADMEYLHNHSLRCLSQIGMTIENASFLKALHKRGAVVDYDRCKVRFPAELIEETLQLARNENPFDPEGFDVKEHVFSWHTFNQKNSDPIQCSFGGACLNFLDNIKSKIRLATYRDFRDIVRIGEEMSEVASVGNPVLCSLDVDGNEIDNRLKTIIGASILAKHTTKWGEAEVWNEQELDYIVEIGSVLRGGYNEYIKRPMLISPKDTITPFKLPQPAADVFLALAKRSMPCTIIPVPIAGVSNPVSPVSSTIVSNAEILGVMAAIKAVNPSAPVSGGVISGVMNMSTVTVNYSAPEAILSDVALAQLHREYYRLNCGVGAGYIDAVYPSIQSGIDSTFKTLCSCLGGNITYPAGLLDAGRMFSPEQAMIDVEIAQNIKHLLRGFEVSDESLAFDDICEMGIGGNFLGTDHTVDHFKDNWIPKLFYRGSLDRTKHFGEDELLKRASRKWNELLEKSKMYTLEDQKIGKIDEIVDRARRNLLK